MTYEEAFAELVGNPADFTGVGEPPATVTTDVLADTLGLSANRVLVLVRAGHIPRLERGRYDLRAAVRAYCDFMRKNPVGRGASDPEMVAHKRDWSASKPTGRRSATPRRGANWSPPPRSKRGGLRS